MKLRRLRPGEEIRAEDLNKIIEAVNRLEIIVVAPLVKNEGSGGITIALDEKDKIVVA